MRNFSICFPLMNPQGKRTQKSAPEFTGVVVAGIVSNFQKASQTIALNVSGN
jgi:hypothetical protein